MAWTGKQRSGRYSASYRLQGEDYTIKGTFTRRADALAEAQRERGSKRRGEFIDPELSGQTFSTRAESYLAGARPMLKGKTVASYESLLSSRILPTFGEYELRSILPSDITTWIGSMVADGLSPSRIRQAHVVLRLVLESAVRDGYLARNPAVGVKLPRIEHREAAFFEPQVVDAIADALGPPYDGLVAVLGLCGLRWGEAAALRRRHVDALRRRLVVEESLAEIGGHLTFGTTKSDARRAVPVPHSVMAALDRALEGKGRDDLVFTAPQGGALRYQNFLSRVWHPVLEELKLPVVGVHVLRHSAAARMIQAGASPKTLQKVLGHRSAAFSLTVYGHLFDADLDALADRMDTTRGEATL